MLRSVFICYVVLFGYSVGAVSVGLILRRFRAVATTPTLFDSAAVLALMVSCFWIRTPQLTPWRWAGAAVAVALIAGALLRLARFASKAEKVLPQ